MMPLMILDTAEYLLYLYSTKKISSHDLWSKAMYRSLSVPSINLKTGLIEQSLGVEIY